MPYQKLFVVVGLLGVATCLRAQQPINPPSPVPQAVTTPFIADPTQAETPRAKAGTQGEAGPEFSGKPNRSADTATGSRAPACRAFGFRTAPARGVRRERAQ